MIILAAGQGTRLRPLTDEKPKCMVPLHGRPLLDWQIGTARSAGIEEIVVVGGYRADCLERDDCKLIINERFETTNMVESLMCARDWLSDGCIVSYGDIVYEPRVLRSLLNADSSINIVVDSAWREYWQARFDNPLDDAESLELDKLDRITSIGQSVTDIDAIKAQYVGLMSFDTEGIQAVLSTYEKARKESSEGKNPFGGTRTLDGMYMTDLLQGMITQGHELRPTRIDRGWFEIDNLTDLHYAESHWYGDSGMRVAC